MAIHEIEVLPWQGEFLEYNEDIACVVGGFASGKSFIAANWFADRCLQFPMATHCIATKDLPQAKRGPIATLKGVLDTREVEYSYNSSTGEITLANGCRIKVLSVQNYLGFRSLEADTIWCDETADWGPSSEVAFTRYLAPRLRYSPDGKQYRKFGMKPQLRITTNPSAIGSWLYELIVEKGYCKCWNVSLRDNFLMQDLEQYIDRQERSMSPDLWPFLIDGNWGSTTVGTVYKGFARNICCVEPPAPLPPLAIDMNKPLLWSLDFNVGLMCSVVAQIHQQQRIVRGGNHAPAWDLPGMSKVKNMQTATTLLAPDYQHALVYVLREFRIPNAGAPDVLDAFLKEYGAIAKQTGVILYGDASGGAKSQTITSSSAARSNWAILVQGLQREGIRVEFRVQTQNPAVMDRVNEVKAQVLTKDGKGLFIDDKAAPYTVTDLEAVRWKEGTNDIDKDDEKMTHLSDALGYLIWVERTLSKRQHVQFRRTLE